MNKSTTEYQKYISKYKDFSECQSHHAICIAEKTEKTHDGLIGLLKLVIGILCSVQSKINGITCENTEEVKYFSGLFASFVIGIPLFESAILQGRYLQSATLLRHEMEILAQIKGCYKNKCSGEVEIKKSIKNNVIEKNIVAKVNIKSMKHPDLCYEVYKMLSEIAHSLNIDIIDMVTSVTDLETNITKDVPIFKEKLSFLLISLHISMVINLIKEIDSHYSHAHNRPTLIGNDKSALDMAQEFHLEYLSEFTKKI